MAFGRRITIVLNNNGALSLYVTTDLRLYHFQKVRMHYSKLRLEI